MLNRLWIIFPLIWLQGCVFEPKPQKPKIIHTTPPNSLLRLYRTPQPPDKNNYLSLSEKDKELVLADYTVDLLTTIGKYKRQTIKLRKWKNEIKKKENSKEE